ncbi:MAG: MAPEG family protein [Pseudomonadota bacterium]
MAFGIYAGLSGLVLIALAAHVGATRRRLSISIGDGANPEMIRAMRGQLNFVELVPLALILLLTLALAGAPVVMLHLLGLALVVGRVLHALHFIQSDAPGWQRAAGASLTLLVLLLGAAWLVGLGLWSIVAR